MQKNGPGPSGCGLKSALVALPRSEIEPLFPVRGALLPPILDRNTAANNSETASSR